MVRQTVSRTGQSNRHDLIPNTNLILTIFQASESIIKMLIHISRVKHHIFISPATQIDKFISSHAIILLKQIERYEKT